MRSWVQSPELLPSNLDLTLEPMYVINFNYRRGDDIKHEFIKQIILKYHATQFKKGFSGE